MEKIGLDSIVRARYKLWYLSCPCVPESTNISACMFSNQTNFILY